MNGDEGSLLQNIQRAMIAPALLTALVAIWIYGRALIDAVMAGSGAWRLSLSLAVLWFGVLLALAPAAEAYWWVGQQQIFVIQLAVRIAFFACLLTAGVLQVAERWHSTHGTDSLVFWCGTLIIVFIVVLVLELQVPGP